MHAAAVCLDRVHLGRVRLEPAARPVAVAVVAEDAAPAGGGARRDHDAGFGERNRALGIRVVVAGTVERSRVDAEGQQTPAGRPTRVPGSGTVEPEHALRVHWGRVERTPEGDERGDRIGARELPRIRPLIAAFVAQHSTAGVLVRGILEARAAAPEPRHARVERTPVNRKPRDRIRVPWRTAVLPAVPTATPNHAVRSLPWLPHGEPCSKPRVKP